MSICKKCGFAIRKTIVCADNRCGMNGGNYNKEDLYINKYGPISNVNIERLLKSIQSFRGDNLPKGIWNKESGIVNLDSRKGPGTLGCILQWSKK